MTGANRKKDNIKLIRCFRKGQREALGNPTLHLRWKANFKMGVLILAFLYHWSVLIYVSFILLGNASPPKEMPASIDDY